MELDKFISNGKRPLPVFLLLDTSGSMSGEKIEVLNMAVDQMINDFRNANLTNVDLKICVVTFGGSANVALDLTSVGDAEFRHLSANGMTPLGGALHLASEIINDKERVSSKGYRPTILLVSDGMPNDNWESEFDSFVNGKRTGKCERWAIAIGSDADRNMLTRFINNPINRVFEANMANEISSYFNFVTMSTSTRAASINPNESLKIEELKEVMEDEMPEFNFDLWSIFAEVPSEGRNILRLDYQIKTVTNSITLTSALVQ